MQSSFVPLFAAIALSSGVVTAVVAQEGQSPPPAAKSEKPEVNDPFSTESPDVYPPADFHVRMEIFALPMDATRRALRQFPKQADLYAWLEAEMQKPAPAVKLERMDVLRVRSGGRAKLEGIDEYPYPTELDPAGIPHSAGIIGTPAPSTTPMPVPGAPVSEKKGHPDTSGGKDLPPAFPVSGPPGSVPADRVLPPWSYKPPTMSAFASRNTGWTLELEIMARDDGKGAVLRPMVEFVRPAGWETINRNAETVQALFEKRQLGGVNMAAMFGRPVFAGTFNRPARTGAGGAAREDSTRLAFFTVTPTREALNPKPVPAPAKDDPPQDKVEVLVRFDAISLPPAPARKALLTHPKEAELYSWLESELSRKDSGVALEHTATLRALDGERVKTEPVMAFPYATEITNGQAPLNITLPQNLRPIAIPGTNSQFTPWSIVATAPSATAEKHLGWFIELEFSGNGDGGPSGLNLAVENNRLAGKPLFGANKEIWQPVFEAQRVTCEAEVFIGRPLLISTFTPPTGTGIPGANTSDRVWFLFATATAAE